MINTRRNALLRSLAETISDYRRNEVAPITPTHVEKWLSQFDVDDQPVILTEMDLVLKRFYFSKARIKECLRSFLRNDIVATHDPRTLLPHLCFLRIQQRGASQRAMLAIIDEILREEYKCSIALCGTSSIEMCIYIDDGIYTGNRLRYDLTPGTNAPAWITNEALPNSTLMIYTIAVHSEGRNYVEPLIRRAAQEKGITLKWKHSLTINNTRFFDSRAEVLWPEELSHDPCVNSYVSQLRTSLAQKNWPDYYLFRYDGIPRQETLFSSPEARRIVEMALLKKGVQIISACQAPAPSMRPLAVCRREADTAGQ